MDFSRLATVRYNGAISFVATAEENADDTDDAVSVLSTSAA
jgi:hypothetical protein